MYNISFVFCTQSFQKSVLKCKTSALCFQFGLISIREQAWVISAGKCLWTLKRELLFPGGRVWWPGWLSPSRTVPMWPCWRSMQGRGWCCCSAKSGLWGKGRNWCCALYGMLERTESIVRKSSLWHCPGIICIGHLGVRIAGKMGFIVILVVWNCIETLQQCLCLLVIFFAFMRLESNTTRIMISKNSEYNPSCGILESISSSFKSFTSALALLAETTANTFLALTLYFFIYSNFYFFAGIDVWYST